VLQLNKALNKGSLRRALVFSLYIRVGIFLISIGWGHSFLLEEISIDADIDVMC